VDLRFSGLELSFRPLAMIRNSGRRAWLMHFGARLCHNPARPAPSMDSSPDPRTAQRHAYDLEFARRAQANDPAAIEELERRLACLPAMVRHQNRSLGAGLDEHDVEEVVRETALALWRKLPQFEGRSTLETWAFRFAMLEVLKSLQARARRPHELEIPEHLVDPRRESEEEDVPSFEPAELAAGLGELTTGAAEVIRLRHWDELSFEEIAARVRLPLNTIKARYYRGLARLREILERKQRRTGE
jgi:RNA polymerase sigma-70 factor, ECF subfamily